MDKNRINYTLGIVCVILTVAICIQIKTVNSTNATVAQTFTENSLRDDVLKWKEKYDNISEELNSAEKALDKIRTEATKNDSTSSNIEKEISLNNNLLGMTNVIGQGVEVIVKDGNASNIGPFEDISEIIVHDSDLRRIVNDLKNAGAEAISINGQRLVNSTAITCIGNVIKVNDEKIASPFTIKAIGLQESLSGIDMAGSYIYWLKEKGLEVSVKKSNKIEIPKYTGAISAKYMRTLN